MVIKCREPKMSPETKMKMVSFLNMALKQPLKVNSSKTGAKMTEATKTYTGDV